MDRGAWWATVHGVTKELDMTDQLNKNINSHTCVCVCVHVLCVCAYLLIFQKRSNGTIKPKLVKLLFMEKERSGMRFTEMESKTSLKVLYNTVFTLVKWKWKLLSHVSLWPHVLYSPWNSPGQNTGVGSLSLLQGIFPTQEPNLGLPHCRWILYHLSHKASPRILEWVTYPFSSSSSQPRNQTGVSCFADGFFTNWAMREALIFILDPCKCFA